MRLVQEKDRRSRLYTNEQGKKENLSPYRFGADVEFFFFRASTVHHVTPNERLKNTENAMKEDEKRQAMFDIS